MEMTEQEILDGNKLIALFMGYKEDEIQAEDWCGCNVLDEVFAGLKEMQPANYHENWSRLMPVVEKISLIRFSENGTEIDDFAYPRTFGMPFENEGGIEFMVRINRHSLFQDKTFIGAAYLAVIDFISNHNHKN